MMLLSDAQVAQFHEQGFLNLGQVFSDAEVMEIRAEYDQLVRPEVMALGSEATGKFAYRAMLHFRSDALKRYVNHPELLEFVMQLLGPDVRLWWEQGVDKGPGAGSYIPWHQDNGYSDHVAPEYLTTWLALDDSDPENGGIYAVPGSHKQGPVEHELWRDTPHYYMPDVDESQAIPLTAKAGEYLIFSSLLAHQTVGNTTTDRHRRSWVMQYLPGHAANRKTGAPFLERAWVAQDGAVLDEPYSEEPFDIRRH